MSADINEGRRRLAEASEWPWNAALNSVHRQSERVLEDATTNDIGLVDSDRDAALIVWLVNHAAEMLDEIERLRDANTQLLFDKGEMFFRLEAAEKALADVERFVRIEGSKAIDAWRALRTEQEK